MGDFRPPTPQEVVGAIAEGAGSLMNAAGEVVKSVAGLGQNAAEQVSETVTDVMEAATKPMLDILDKLNAIANAAPALRPPTDPVQAVSAITQAIQNAESILNKNRLSIAQGTIEIELAVGVLGAGQAATKITLNIGPTPIA